VPPWAPEKQIIAVLQTSFRIGKLGAAGKLAVNPKSIGTMLIEKRSVFLGLYRPSIDVWLFLSTLNFVVGAPKTLIQFGMDTAVLGANRGYFMCLIKGKA
jgi:hypothetical protein